jgi:hypothetical protein
MIDINAQYRQKAVLYNVEASVTCRLHCAFHSQIKYFVPTDTSESQVSLCRK